MALFRRQSIWKIPIRNAISTTRRTLRKRRRYAWPSITRLVLAGTTPLWSPRNLPADNCGVVATCLWHVLFQRPIGPWLQGMSILRVVDLARLIGEDGTRGNVRRAEGMLVPVTRQRVENIGNGL